MERGIHSDVFKDSDFFSTKGSTSVSRKKSRPDASKPPPFATSQSTQMIVGADDSTDSVILCRADTLYTGFKLRRVYYSGFSPIPEPSVLLPLKSPPLLREHRLYQADWC